MKYNKLRLNLALLATPLVCLFAAPSAMAQEWPKKQTIRIVSPYAPGGTTDVMARMIGQRLSEKIGQTVIVENRGGAGGNIGTDVVAKANPDGYTLLLAASGPLVIAPALYSKLPYQPLKDFTYITPVANAAFVVVANVNSGLDSMKDVIEQGKKEGKLAFASAGSGTPQHIIGELLNIQAGTKIQHIPYKGSGPAMNDLVGGQVQMAIENPIVAMPHVKSGKLKVLAVTGETRSPALPDVPTVAEIGLTNFEARPWYGLVGPAGMPKDVTFRLNTAVGEILNEPEVKERIQSLGAQPMYMPPEKFRTFVENELEKWTRVVKTSGATVD
jgi:tripartite-type tricarboxylate transporter receptor subunit TctC